MGNNIKQNFSLSAWDIISCPRGVYHKKKKTPLPLIHPEVAKIRENYSRVAEIGKSIQRNLIAQWTNDTTLVTKGYKIPNDWDLSCEFDAIRKFNGEFKLYEIKGVSQDFFKQIRTTKKPRLDNKIQLIIYHHFLKNNYPNLKPILLYVNRKNHKEALAMLIQYGQEEIEKVYQTIFKLKESIQNSSPLNPIENIIFDRFEKKYIINPTAIICDYHALCCNDDYWYPKALEEIEKLNKKMN